LVREVPGVTFNSTDPNVGGDKGVEHFDSVAGMVVVEKEEIIFVAFK
jgi:hypothetical protein